MLLAHSVHQHPPHGRELAAQGRDDIAPRPVENLPQPRPAVDVSRPQGAAMRTKFLLHMSRKSDDLAAQSCPLGGEGLVKDLWAMLLMPTGRVTSHLANLLDT